MGAAGEKRCPERRQHVQDLLALPVAGEQPAVAEYVEMGFVAGMLIPTRCAMF